MALPSWWMVSSMPHLWSFYVWLGFQVGSFLTSTLNSAWQETLVSQLTTWHNTQQKHNHRVLQTLWLISLAMWGVAPLVKWGVASLVMWGVALLVVECMAPLVVWSVVLLVVGCMVCLALQCVVLLVMGVWCVGNVVWCCW